MLFYLPGQHASLDCPELVAAEITDVCWQTMATLVHEQAHLFRAQEKTTSQIANQLASYVWEHGLRGYSPLRLRRALVFDDLSDLLALYLSQVALSVATQLLCAQLIKRAESHASPQSDPSPSCDDEHTSNAPVLKVSEDECSCRARTRATPQRSGRDTRRTRFCDARTMPNLPARVLGGDPSPDSAIPTAMESSQRWRGGKTTLVPASDISQLSTLLDLPVVESCHL